MIAGRSTDHPLLAVRRRRALNRPPPRRRHARRKRLPLLRRHRCICLAIGRCVEPRPQTSRSHRRKRNAVMRIEHACIRRGCVDGVPLRTVPVLQSPTVGRCHTNTRTRRMIAPEVHARCVERDGLIPLIHAPLLRRIVARPGGLHVRRQRIRAHLPVVQRAQPVLHRHRCVGRGDARMRRDIRDRRSVERRAAGGDHSFDARR